MIGLKSIFDALNGILWRDDALIVSTSAAKRYGETPGVAVTVWDSECNNQ